MTSQLAKLMECEHLNISRTGHGPSMKQENFQIVSERLHFQMLLFLAEVTSTHFSFPLLDLA